MNARDRCVVGLEADIARAPAGRSAEGTPKPLEGFPLLDDQAPLVVGIHHGVADAGRADGFPEQRGAKERVPERKHLAKVAVVQPWTGGVGEHVMQAVKFWIDKDLFEESAETDADIGMGEVLDQFAEQDQQREFVRRHPHGDAHPGENEGLKGAIEVTAAVVAPAAQLALTVVQAVHGPPPRNCVLGAMEPVVGEIVNQVIEQEAQERMGFEHGQPMRDLERRRLGAGVVPQIMAQGGEHQVAEQREQAEQHDQRIVQIDAGEAAILPLLGGHEALQGPKDERDDGQLQGRNDDCLRNLFRRAKVLPAQGGQDGGHPVAADPGDPLLPEELHCGHRVPD